MKPPIAKRRSEGEASFSHSNYLKLLARRYPECVDCEPQQAVDAAFETLKQASGDDTALAKALRQFKAKIALVVALADLRAVWELPQVTQTLTKAADFAVQKALSQIMQDSFHGLFVLAMGKMGAFELNYSSDIDLILFHDGSSNETIDFERIAKRLISLINETTADGYVFRLDVRLRPDPSSTPLVLSTTRALYYYESMGQTWERSAFIKARVCAGDVEAGNSFLNDLRPFVWRKYLDYASINEIHEMKEQINAFKGFDDIDHFGHNVKLGRGGIREIEFFVQAQQLLSGGRNVALRNNQTIAALHELVSFGYVEAGVAKELSQAYRFLRDVEHRLQMINDQQTHSLPNNAHDFAEFSNFCGFKSAASFQKELLGHLKCVEAAYSQLFKQEAGEKFNYNLDFTTQKPAAKTMSHLIQYGFEDALAAYQLIYAWRLSLKSRRLKEVLEPLLPALLTHFGREGEPDLALRALDKLLIKARQPLDLVSMLSNNAQIQRIFALILSSAPRLSNHITRRAHVLDGLFEPAFTKPSVKGKEVQKALQASLKLAHDDEDYLDRMRIFGQEQFFLNSIKALAGNIDLKNISGVFTDLADIFIEEAFNKTRDILHEAHGSLKGENFAVLALGKCGSGEMSATSDLDLIILFDYEEGCEASDGAKPLYTSQYTSKFAQKLVSILTIPTSQGELYETDLRLRPSGKSGAIATRLSSFKDYQLNEAWVWELQSLTRARVVVASHGFGDKVEKLLKSILSKKRDANFIKKELFEMRQSIASHHGEDDAWNFKYAKGGLIDLEFIAQGLQLLNSQLLVKNTGLVFEKACKLGILSREDTSVLTSSLEMQAQLTHIFKICISENSASLSKGFKKLLVNATAQPDFERLTLQLFELQKETRTIFEKLFKQE